MSNDSDNTFAKHVGGASVTSEIDRMVAAGAANSAATHNIQVQPGGGQHLIHNTASGTTEVVNPGSSSRIHDDGRPLGDSMAGIEREINVLTAKLRQFAGYDPQTGKENWFLQGVERELAERQIAQLKTSALHQHRVNQGIQAQRDADAEKAAIEQARRAWTRNDPNREAALQSELDKLEAAEAAQRLRAMRKR